jgi:prepilin-type N-terminal cleavage/methylation domain-containing protein
MIRGPAHLAQRGFTLIEVLAAFAIASVIIIATAALFHTVALSFDRGTSRVSGGERLALAAERLATDLGAARFVLRGTPAGPVAAFIGQASKITFIAPARAGLGTGANVVDPAAPGDDVVSITIEAVGDETQIVRRRAPWAGLPAPFETAALSDDVALLTGDFDAAFAFGRLAPDGTLTWSSSWPQERSLPRLVKLSLRDRASGVDLIGGAEFTIRADASGVCARADAGLECLTGTAAKADGAQPPAKRASP